MATNTSNTRQALWVALGSFTSLGFSIVSSMILSRYFVKQDYGTYKQVMYIYNTLLVVFTLGLPQSFGYFLPRVSLEAGKSVVNKITNILFLLGVIFAALLFFGAPIISTLLKNSQLIVALRIFSPVPIFLLPTLGLDSIYATYKKTYISAMYTVLTRVFLLICVATPVFLFSATYKVALWGFLVASFFNFLLALYLKNKPFKNLKHENSKYTYKDILKFSLPLVFAAIWATLINSTDQFFISRYFGPITFAEFSNGAMELPFVGMIISACSTVLYPLFSKFNNEGLDPQNSIYPIWKSVFNKTAMLTYPLIVFCWFYADQIMTLLYGAQYENSGIYFRIKLVVNLFTLISFYPVVMSIGKTKYYANVHMYGAISLIICEFCCVKLCHNPYVLVGVSVVCQIGRILALLHLVASYFKVSLYKLFSFSFIAKLLIPSIIILSVISNIRYFESPLLNVSVGGCIYLVFMVVISKLLSIDYLGLVKSVFK